MITSITIENYKCFQSSTPFHCGKINLFAGINGRGKSSVLQALLLLSQSLEKSDSWEHLHLKGKHINLGEYSDVKNSSAARSKDICFTFATTDGIIIPLRGNEDEKSTYRIRINNTNEIIASLNATGRRDATENMFRHIHYVSADRLGPRLFMEKTDLPEFVHVGKRGEYCFEILAQAKAGQLDITPNENLYRGQDANSLLQQTIEWMSYILDGARIDFQGGNTDSAVLTMMANNRSDANLYKPVNIGFGYSYILPLIVAGLIAAPGEILIIENPEAHLHPRAQSRIAEFYSRISATGVQIFIETHSEHVLNGVRLSSIKPEIGITTDNVAIFFFDEDFTVKTLSVTEKGKMSQWPSGFFDQQELDLAAIFAITSGAKQ